MTKMPVLEDPRVVIVGRPNVGKSSLFNRLLRRRAAIVNSEPGVTRDRLTGTVVDAGHRWTLIDTGGLEGVGTFRTMSATAAAIRRQVETALADASLALLMVDAHSGLTGLDAAIADELRRRAMPTLLIVNKCDHDAAEITAAEFSRLGWSGLPISASHGRGIDELVEAVAQALDGMGAAAVAAVETETADPIKRLAIVGRPNVGKSSLVNAFLREDRVLVSDVPGTTRDTVDVPLSIAGKDGATDFIMTDTAGLRHTREMESAVEVFSIRQAERAVQRCDIAVLVLEAGRGPTAQDKKIAALISQHRRAAMLLVNKLDLIDDATLADCRSEIALRLPFMKFCPIRFVSARSGRNLKSALTLMASLGQRLDLRLTTGTLNRAIERAVERVQPPLVRGRRLKIFYVTQTGNRPLTITLFANDATCMNAAYRLFLEHELRRCFPKLEGLPIVFEFKDRH